LDNFFWKLDSEGIFKEIEAQANCTIVSSKGDESVNIEDFSAFSKLCLR
jgi:hypothetical protein